MKIPLKKIMESKFDFDVTNILEQLEDSGISNSATLKDERLKTCYVAQDEDYEFQVCYAGYVEAEEERTAFDAVVERYERHQTTGAVEAEIKKKGSEDFCKITITGTFVNEGKDFQYVFIQAGDMTIDANTYSDDKEDIDYVIKIVRKIGY